jgi:hypothetical protein
MSRAENVSEQVGGEEDKSSDAEGESDFGAAAQKRVRVASRQPPNAAPCAPTALFVSRVG